MLTENSTKQDEVEHYKKFLSSLPKESYLFGILADSLQEVKGMIESDLAWAVIPSQMERIRSSIQNELGEEKRLKESVNSLEKQERETRRRLEGIQEQIINVQRVAREIANCR